MTAITTVPILMLLLLCLAVSGSAQTQQTGADARKMLDYIADSVTSGKTPKPLTRKVVAPADMSGDLMFSKQSDLTPDFVERYLSRAVSHFLPIRTPDRSIEFFRYTGTKYVHWAHLFWGSMPSQEKFEIVADIADRIHGTEWGKDVVLEAGVMEIITRDSTDATPIPDWMYQCMEELGITKSRKPGPNGPRFFSHDNMFDRNAKDWPNRHLGLWDTKPDDDAWSGVPDITMLETQLWYAYQISQFIDAGFEGILFGQIGLVGRRDRGWTCAYALAEFAKKYAATRAYRNAVFVSSHHWQVNYRGKPIYTHLSWPSRLFYSDKFRHGMECGLNAAEDGQHHTRREFVRLLGANHDLPILIEIDNYGKMPPNSSIASDPEGNDEITAFNLKPWWARAAFLRQYYLEFRTYRNKFGNCRVHLAPSGQRCDYKPYKEDGGEEETIRLLFETAK